MSIIRIVPPSKSRSHKSDLVALIEPGILPIPWQGAQLLLRWYQDKISRDQFEAILAPHRNLLGLCLGHASRQLLADPKVAHPLGFLTHNSVIMRDYINEWVALFEKLCRLLPLTIQVSNVYFLDLETLLLFRFMIRKSGENCPIFLLGTAPVTKAGNLIRRVCHTQISGHISHLVSLPITERVEGELGTSEVSLATGLEDHFIARAYACLERDLQTTEELTQTSLALDCAFACFSFAAVADLGHRLLSRHPNLENAEHYHRLTGIAAYNLQVESQGDLELADFLQKHFEAAWELEKDLIIKSHLLYRLAINRGRRQGELDEAMELANQSVTIIEHLDHPIASFTRAWALNGRAYLHARLGNPNKGISDCLAAHKLLDGLTLQQGPIGEVRLSLAVIVDNLGKLYLFSDNNEQGIHWQQELASLESGFPELRQVSPERWIQFLRREYRYREAIDLAKAGYDWCEEQMLPILQDRYTAELADLYYRLGEPEKAQILFEKVLPLRHRIGSPEDVFRTELNLALSSSRAGNWEKASTIFKGLLQNPLCKEGVRRAKVLAVYALNLARSGARQPSEAVLNQAIESAVECGAQDVLLYVAKTAGDSCQLLGLENDARQAYENALDIAQAGGSDMVDSVTMFAVFLALKRYDEALDLLMPALEDADTWWLLPKLAVDWSKRRLHGMVPEVKAPLDILVRIMYQRQGGQDVAESLSKQVESSL